MDRGFTLGAQAGASSLAEASSQAVPGWEVPGAARLVGRRQRSSHTGGRRGLGSALGQCASIPRLLLAAPTWTPATLGLSCHHPGPALAAAPGLDAAWRSDLSHTLSHVTGSPSARHPYGTGNSGALSLQSASVCLTHLLAAYLLCQAWMQGPGGNSQLPFWGGPGPPTQRYASGCVGRMMFTPCLFVDIINSHRKRCKVAIVVPIVRTRTLRLRVNNSSGPRHGTASRWNQDSSAGLSASPLPPPPPPESSPWREEQMQWQMTSAKQDACSDRSERKGPEIPMDDAREVSQRGLFEAEK